MRSSAACDRDAVARWPALPSASLSAPIRSERTALGSRNLSSVLAGWTFTSTSSGGSVRNRAKHGIAPLRQEIAIGRAHGAGEQLVAHGTPIHREIKLRAVRPMQRRQSGEALRARSRRARRGPAARPLRNPRRGCGRAAPDHGRSARAGRPRACSVVRSPLARLKAISGLARASRFTMSAIAALSARSDFMNFSRAGVA